MTKKTFSTRPPSNTIDFRSSWIWLAASAVLLVFLAIPRTGATAPEKPYSTAAAEPLAASPLLELTLSPERAELWLEDMADASERARLVQDVVQIYETRDFEPAWVGTQPILRRARTMIEQIEQASTLGLSPEHYPVATLLREVKQLELDPQPMPTELMRVETRLTGALALFVRDLHQGHIADRDIPNWYKKAAPADVVSQVNEILDSRSIAIEPEHEGYRDLAIYASALQNLIDEGGWPTVPDGEFAPGESIPADMYEPLVARLRAGGDLEESWTPEPVAGDRVYGPGLVQAVQAFQERHGLDVDGKIGPDTLEAMNVPADERLDQITANLERWRWLPATLPADRVEVNVAAFELRGYRDNAESVRMDVAVGKPSWATPIFEDEILYAEVNPYWNVPESIAVDEVLPALRRNPNHLAEENMEIVAGWEAENAGQVINVDWSQPGHYGPDYRIRQRPGSRNALGRIKFIFPNQHGVYLHDTPAQSAFKKADRAVSHGCVRVSDPMALASFLFAHGESGWESYEEIQDAFNQRRPKRVDLERPMPVLFHYRTAFVGDDGRLNFRRDLYGLDKVIVDHVEEELAETETFVAENEAEDHQRARKPRVST